jgi:hypothetical protein
VSVLTTRRYYLLKRLAARRDCLEEDAWIHKQAGEPGIDLPAGFPSRAALVAAGYSTREDVNGASVQELRRYACLSRSDAEAVIAAVAAT